MRQFDPTKLIVHIEDAKAWLNQASDEYRQENPARGEMILNIAQAEVKHAWELSHQQFVTKPQENVTNHRANRFWMAAAAVFIAAVLFTASISLGTMIAKHNSTVQPRVALQPVKQPATNSVTVPAVSLNPSVTELPAIKNTAVVKPVVKTVQPTTAPEEHQPAPVVAVIIDTAHTERNPVQPAGPRTQPAARITIDEDDLAKEASRTLRSGK